jgi:tetratricopeptide (TPR) repeat protein
MKHKTFYTTLLSILSYSITFGQDYKAEFEKYCQEGDTSKQFEVLKEWELKSPKNPELFTSYFNYYFLKSKQEVLSMTTEQPNGESLSFQDSTGSTAGYIGSSIYYEPTSFNKAIEKIDEGISLYPNRLDMRFGKIYVLGQVEDWSSFTNEIIKAVQYSNQNNNKWTWTYGEPRENGQEIFLNSIQDYQVTIYNTGDNDLLVNMRQIAEEVLKYYPNHVESLSNISITYLLTDEYDKGITPLLKAEKINPKDPVILGNIAQGYKLKGDKTNAIKYYRKVIKYGDDEYSTYAKTQINELSK